MDGTDSVPWCSLHVIVPLVRHHARTAGEKPPPTDSPPVLVGLVPRHLRAWAGCSRNDAGLEFYRTQVGAEVDFVVYATSGLEAFKAANVRKVHSADLPSLRIFREDYPEFEAAMFNRGSERMRIDGVRYLPLQDFLRQTAPNRGLVRWL